MIIRFNIATALILSLLAFTSSAAFQLQWPSSFPPPCSSDLKISLQRMTHCAVLAGIISVGLSPSSSSFHFLTGSTNNYINNPMVPVAFAVDIDNEIIASSSITTRTTPLSPSTTDVNNNNEHIRIWNLGNGEVRLPDPFVLDNTNTNNNNIPTKLENPRLLGSGGGGAVFAFDSSSSTPTRSSSSESVASSKSSTDGTDSSSSRRGGTVAVKVSWLRSTESVKKECLVLQALEERRFTATAAGKVGVERCLYSGPYLFDTRRQLIVMEPVIEDTIVSSVDQLPSTKNQAHSVQCVVQTMVQMLAARVVTTDVQPLISKQTGDVLFIDMTEAEILPLPSSSSSTNNKPLSFIDLALTSSFCVEMLALIPESFYQLASDTLIQEIKALENVGGVQLSNEMLDILGSQTIFTKEALDFIETKMQ